ncbi:hypothetical protein BD410DRAFT_840649 [Rickenella mellea]|uniref:F-box domain-containing protein n=1 Tax=Rickenella mellea TaxID=50990 RepID=A0A4Y7Q0L2_9AGAM|nr:hypothetical protein BD410DRAFT_840649 [Rickenella mellea]
MPNNQQLSQITRLELDFKIMFLDIRSLARAIYQAKTLQNLSLTLTDCYCHYPCHQNAEEIPPLHSLNSKALKLIVKGGSTMVKDVIQPLNRALRYLSPSEVDISLGETPMEALYYARGELFPYGSTIRLHISTSCDLLEILAGLVRRCNIARCVHFNAPLGYFSANEIETCNWWDFASLRHLRFENCDRLCEEDVKIMASNLLLDEADVGLQSLEFISCKNISEDFLLNLGDEVGERLIWSF